LALGGLIRIGVGAERDRLADVARMAELLVEEFSGVRLVEDLGLEVEARRKIHVGMGRPCEAVAAAVLAAAIRIDRLREADVRRVVPGDDRAGGLADVFGIGMARRVFLEIPAVVESDLGAGLEAAWRVDAGTASLAHVPAEVVAHRTRPRNRG